MKKSRTMFIKNLRYMCLIGIIALGLMTIIGSGGGGDDRPWWLITSTETPDTSTGDTGSEVTIGEAIDNSWITYNVVDAKSLITTENIATRARSAKRSLRRDGRSIPTYVFRKPMTEAEARARQAESQSGNTQKDGDEEVGCNLISIDEDGVASDALESLEGLNVMYTVLSRDGKKVFVVLDPDYIQDSQNTIGATNCMMFVVDLQTNGYTCLDHGFAPQRIDNSFKKTISNSSVKPIQMDDDGNIYYLGRPFTVNSNTRCEEWDNFGNCVKEHTDYWANIDWRVQPVIRMISVKKDEDGNPLYNEDGYLLYEDSIDLTPDNNYIDNFLVSKDGILVYTYHNRETNDGGIKMYADGSTNELTGDTSGWWGDMFYVIGDSGTVIYGSGSSGWGTGGVKFAQKHPVVPGARVVYQLDTRLFTSRNNSPTPSRIMMGDDGYIYGLFNEDTGYWDESLGTHVNQARINLFRILPYKQTPIISISVKGNWWDAMRGFDVQISKGYAYYVQKDKHPADLYGDRDVIKITKLATGDTTTLLDATNKSGGYTLWDDRYELYSWKLVGSKIHFSGFDNIASQVVTGEIDITKLRQGKPPTEYLTIREAASALGESARIRDMEIVRPEQVYDPVGAPVITKIYTDPENLYSISIDFSKYMNRTDVNSKVSIVDAAQGEDWEYNPQTMRLWSYRTLHFIIDNPVLDDDGNLVENATTDPLAADTLYRVSVEGSAYDQANEWQLDMVEDPMLSTTFKTVPDHGWYQSTAVALEGYSDGSVGKYVRKENTDTNMDFYRLLGTKDGDGNWVGTRKQHFKVEFSIQYLGDSWHHWKDITLRLNDAKMIDWSNVDWDRQKITDADGNEWKRKDGHREDADGKEYYWCNNDVCGEGVEGIYDQDGTVYTRVEGHHIDIYNNEYYWYWDPDTNRNGYKCYDAGGNYMGIILWVDGYYTDEDGIKYIHSFGEWREENNPDNILDWDSEHSYTWHEGYHQDENGAKVDLPALEWVHGLFKAPDGTSVSEHDFHNNMTDVQGYYYRVDDPSTRQENWQDGWNHTIDPDDMVLDDKKDYWDARLWRLELDSSGQIRCEYRTSQHDQSSVDVSSTSDEEKKREWRKIVVSAYGDTLKCSIIDEEGEEIKSFVKTDYFNQSRDNSGYYFLDLNVDSDSISLDNVIITELDETGNVVEGTDLLFEETFTNPVFDSAFTTVGTYSSDW